MTTPAPTCWPYPPKPHLCGAYALLLDGGRCALGVPEPAPVQQDTIGEVQPEPVPGPGQQGLVEPPAVEPETRPLLRRQCTFCRRVLSDDDPARLWARQLAHEGRHRDWEHESRRWRKPSPR